MYLLITGVPPPANSSASCIGGVKRPPQKVTNGMYSYFCAIHCDKKGNFAETVLLTREALQLCFPLQMVCIIALFTISLTLPDSDKCLCIKGLTT